MAEFQTIHVDYAEPHLARTQQILKAHPEVKRLFGNTPSTFWIVLGLVTSQTLVAIALSHAHLGWIFFASYAFGAFANHALFVMIHECTHNLIFKGNAANCLAQIFANFPIVFPSAISFRIYHIKHHLYQGEMDRDADLPRSFEISWVESLTRGRFSR